MAQQTTKLPWFTSEFDLEGLAGGAFVLLASLVLGLIPVIGPILFWLGLILFGLILCATRDARRVPPETPGVVVSPADGVVQSVEVVPPPRELRLNAAEVKRLRLASSPFAANGVRAPATGTVSSFLVEPGSPMAIAFSADKAELDEAFATIETTSGQIGFRVAVGGLGPRVNLDLEADDGVRAGRKIGVRRLGGWCDLFLPLDVDVSLKPGQTVVGGETIIALLSNEDVPGVSEDVSEDVQEQESVPETAPPTETARTEEPPVQDVVEPKADEPGLSSENVKTDDAKDVDPKASTTAKSGS